MLCASHSAKWTLSIYSSFNLHRNPMDIFFPLVQDHPACRWRNLVLNSTWRLSPLMSPVHIVGNFKLLLNFNSSALYFLRAEKTQKYSECSHPEKVWHQHDVKVYKKSLTFPWDKKKYLQSHTKHNHLPYSCYRKRKQAALNILRFCVFVCFYFLL